MREFCLLKPRIIKITLSLLACSLLSNCVHSIDKRITLNPSIDEDIEYRKSLDAATTRSNAIKNFETKHLISATNLSPEFRTALAKRYERLFGEPQGVLEEASDKTGFLVTVYTPDRKTYDLSNAQMWSITLESNLGKKKPTSVKQINDKDRLRPFFPEVSTWSHEYLVLFDSPSTDQSAQLLGKNQTTLNLSNADAQLRLSWGVSAEP